MVGNLGKLWNMLAAYSSNAQRDMSFALEACSIMSVPTTLNHQVDLEGGVPDQTEEAALDQICISCIHDIMETHQHDVGERMFLADMESCNYALLTGNISTGQPNIWGNIRSQRDLHSADGDDRKALSCGCGLHSE